MNTYVVFGIIGIISNFVAALADVPLVKPGKPNPNEQFSIGGVSPWWADVTSKRFKVSFWLSFLGQPGSYVVMWLLADLISGANAPDWHLHCGSTPLSDATPVFCVMSVIV